MAATLATLAGHRITDARAQIPAWGAWYVDATLDGEHTLAGSVEVVLADLRLRGTVIAGGPAKGRSFYRVVAGGGGWGKTLAAKSYATDLGVKVSTIIGDAAREAGETFDTPATVETVGPAFARKRGPAGRVLEQLAPGAWYIDEAGVTRLGARASSTLDARVPRVSQVDKARGKVVLAPTSLATLLPGIVVDGLAAVDVCHEVSAKKGIRTTIYGSIQGSRSRRLAAFRALLEQLDPSRAFRGVTEYRVVLKRGKRWDLQPVRVSTGMPTLQRVKVWPGVAGAEADLQLGSRVLVGFIEGEPARPVVLAFEDAEGEGFVPTTLTLANGTKGIARVDDTVSITSITATAGGDPVVLTSATGRITSGSSKVRCG